MDKRVVFLIVSAAVTGIIFTSAITVLCVLFSIAHVALLESGISFIQDWSVCIAGSVVAMAFIAGVVYFSREESLRQKDKELHDEIWDAVKEIQSRD